MELVSYNYDDSIIIGHVIFQSFLQLLNVSFRFRFFRRGFCFDFLFSLYIFQIYFFFLHEILNFQGGEIEGHAVLGYDAV
jgi:hypothetical protein